MPHDQSSPSTPAASATPPEVLPLLAVLEQRLRESLQCRGIDQPLMVGIHTGGAWLAQHLHQRLGLERPLGTLDISFYRDDFTRVGLNPRVKPSSMPLATEDEHIILVDDVVKSGRTARAALNELFDFGRPASVTLVALLDLDARELPLRPDIVAQVLALPAGEQIKLVGGPEAMRLELRATQQQAPDSAPAATED